MGQNPSVLKHGASGGSHPTTTASIPTARAPKVGLAPSAEVKRAEQPPAASPAAQGTVYDMSAPVLPRSPRLFARFPPFSPFFSPFFSPSHLPDRHRA